MRAAAVWRRPVLRIGTTVKRLIVLSMTLTTGCYTGIVAKEVPHEDVQDGMRYYLPAPYLVITELPKKRWDAQVKFMLDRSKVFTVQPTSHMAKASATIEMNADGTMKSFQLNQHSGDVPEAFITGMKDLTVKALEIEEARYKPSEEEAEDEETGGGPDSAAKTKGAAPTEPRRVYVCKIEGAKPIEGGCSPLAVLELPPAEPGALKVEIKLTEDKADVVLSRKKPFGSNEIRDLVFLKTGKKAVTEPDLTVLRAAVRLHDGKFLIKKKDLDAKKVVTIVMGDQTLDIPS